MIIEKPFEQYIGSWLKNSKRKDRWKFFVLGIDEIKHNKYDDRDTVCFKVILFKEEGTKILGWIGEKKLSREESLFCAILQVLEIFTQ